MKIAWIGCGVMGTSMLLNLKKGGHTVSAGGVYHSGLCK